MSDRAIELIAQNKALVTQRELYKATWDDVGDYLNIYRQYRTSAGAKKTTKIYSSRPLRSHQVLIAGLYSLLTSPSVPWAAIEMRSKALNKLSNVKRWLENSMGTLYTQYSNSGLYNCMSEFYRDLSSYSIADIYADEGKEPGTFRFETVSPYDFTYAENGSREVDTVFREISLTAKQAFDEFPGATFNDALQSILTEGGERVYTEKFPFLHVTKPRKDRSVFGKSALNMPFASYYVDVKAGEIVDESGYREFPHAVARWEKPSNEPYGQCPGMIALPDIKTINKRKYNMLMAEEKVLNPPLDIPEGYKGRINTSPGGLNFREGGQDRIQPLNIAGRMDYSREMLEYDLQQVDTAFFVDIFQMLATIEREMTAYEVSKREAERMLMFGPVVGRLTHETLAKLIVRTFNMAQRMGLFEDPPDEIQGQPWDIVYISPLARAQRAAQGQSLQGALGFLLPLAQVFPAVLDNFDGDKITSYVFELYGCPTDLLVPEEDRDQIRQNRAQQQAMEGRMQIMERLASSAGAAGKANIDTLKALTGGAVGGEGVPGGTVGEA